ncbi:serpin family protein [Streptomyces montanisoli]|uniref:serpin family protein n=1 Tax=Streptomyces montanisoli TaxID=2798581 RepID=UPI0027DD7582|nr:serpin family protein [Streptomyces montanisoli]
MPREKDHQERKPESQRGSRAPRSGGLAARGVASLTSRWAARLDAGHDTVFSAAGVWPLLALLAEVADGPARRELEDVLGAPAQEAANAARALLAELPAAEGLNAALGLWTRRTLPLDAAWLATLPEGSHTPLSGDASADRAALDAWASRQTGGLIDRMPVEVDASTLLVLASALSLTTEWTHPFEDHATHDPASGPWAGAGLRMLTRRTAGIDTVSVAHTPAGPVTIVRVEGLTGIDVHLLLGDPGMGPGEVIGAGTGVLTGRLGTTPAEELPYGDDVAPGLTKDETEGAFPAPRMLSLRTPPFHLTADHDLLRIPDVFGLTAATDATRGHFPGIGAFPLSIRAAAQSAMAEFGPLGFKAAAVTAIATRAMAVSGGRLTRVTATLDRPFGFAAVQRSTGLCLATGWVATPRTRA